MTTIISGSISMDMFSNLVDRLKIEPEKEETKDNDIVRKSSFRKLKDAVKSNSNAAEELEKKQRLEERKRKDKERHEKYVKNQVDREKGFLGAMRKKYNVQYKYKESPSMNLIEDIKNTYQLTETEIQELHKDVRGIQVQRQKSFHTINKINTKEQKRKALKEKCKIQ